MKVWGKEIFSEEGGFTLPEVLVAMLLMLTVSFALYGIFDASVRAFAFGSERVEAVENARAGLGRMEREIRAAHRYDGGELLKTMGLREIRFANDADGDRSVAAPTEEILYRLSRRSPYKLLRASPADDPKPDSVAEPVQRNGLAFSYLKSVDPDVPASEEAEVRVVRIALKVKAGKDTRTLTTDVALRNREDP